MCGILGLATIASRRVGISDDAVARLRDLMTHRGPDGAGLWPSPNTSNVVFAHRRLAVVDPSPAAAQPFVSTDARYAIVYNGELYNDADLRRELATHGVRFRTGSDTETVLAALSHWGIEALPRLRGMFALAFYDTLEKKLLLARDAFGMKPLYFWIEAGDDPLVIFASEPTPILAHPDVPVRPDLVGVSAYLSTIRTVLGNRTMFDGVRTLRPGEALEIDLSGDELSLGLIQHWKGSQSAAFTGSFDDAVASVHQRVRASVAAHMRADVPACALLSGGLDSSVILASMPPSSSTSPWSNRTYCSGAQANENSDFDFARTVARRFDTIHAEAPITRELFAERWASMVSRLLGTPLSTPNEVAINEVARRLRADGQIVALSGEGADELFAGYDIPMAEAAMFELHNKNGVSGGDHQLNANAWIPLNTKQVLLNDAVWRTVEHDAALREFYADEFRAMQDECGDARKLGGGRTPIDAHLRFHRRINLAGLLQRLDTATMLESVEGRTPFADREVAELAESLPMSMKFTAATEKTPAHTKLALRRAFAGELPAEVVERPKASFPLPFQQWVADQAPILRTSSLAQELFAPMALEMIAGDPARHWRAAWPMINVALWGRRWWGG